MPSTRSASARLGRRELRSACREGVAAITSALLVLGLMVFVAAPASAATCTGNEIVCENQLPGTPQSVWDIEGAGDDSIQGFATQMSVNRGSTIDFKIRTDASSYTIEIYRLGFYQGNGARKIADVTPSAGLPQNQPVCATDPATEIYDCGTWSVSASWPVPSTAVSGVYIARLHRADRNDVSHIPFIVRNDTSASQVVFQTSDTTWQAYNTYGGSDFYTGLQNGRAYKVSYNRPFATRGGIEQRDYLFSNEYPMIRFLESNGYDMSYISGLDTDIRGSSLVNHKVFLSVGHDEYWSQGQRDNVEAARDAGVNLAFFSGNEVYWKTRWEPSQDGSNTANRTLVCYKDTWANAPIDPVSPTSTWRDPRFGVGEPENALTGTIYKSNNTDLPITVSAEEGKLRLWRNTPLASQATGSSTALAPHTVGYESDEDLDNGSRPAGLIRMSTTTGPTPEYLQDFGNTVAPGTTTHHLTMYRASSGALVFGAGTVQWAWGLDSNHDGVAEAPDPRMRQATVNLLADMGALATTLVSGLTLATKSTDTSAPTAVINEPASGASLGQGSTVTVTGTANDAGGGRVAGVEVSLDGGATWHPASGTTSFSYTGVLSGTGASVIRARAIDDSANIQSPATELPGSVSCPCSIFGDVLPGTPATADAGPVTLGVKFNSSENGFITGIRFYKGAGNTGTHTGTLYNGDGSALSSVAFTNETQSGWQTASFPSAVPIIAGTTYVAAYSAPNGHYSADSQYFASSGTTTGVLTALGGSSNGNGVYTTGSGIPGSSYLQTNYYVDVVYSASDTTPLSVISTTPIAGSSSVSRGSTVTAAFSRDPVPSSIGFSLKDSSGNTVSGASSYDGTQRTFSFDPTTDLSAGATYTATLSASASGVGPMAAPATWTFTTAQNDSVPGVCPCSIYNDDDVPAVVTANDPNSVELGMAFTADTAGLITGVRFYKGVGNVGAHSISLWSSAGTQLATAPVSSESTSGWQTAAFTTPVSIAAGTTYIASYRAPVGRYSYQAGALGSPVNKGPLHTLANGGRYAYGASAPLNTSSSSYFVGPVFTVAPGAAPTVTTVAPADSTTSVPTSAKISVTFDTSIQPGSASITVTDPNGAVVPGTAGTEPLGPNASFAPGSLAEATTYTVTVTGAKNLGGTPMSTPAVSTFSTSGSAACPCTLLSSSATPPISDSGDGSAITVGLRFSASVDGFITGLRYYRDAANVGTHTGALYTSTGTKLASLTFADGSPGWQTATFSSPVPVTAGTSYVASTFMPSGRYSVASGFFDAPYVNSPLTGTLGTYAYGSENFPGSSWRNSYYFVDVTFTAQDTAAPVVTSTSPDGSAPVQLDSSVSATFARGIANDSSLSFTLKDANNSPVDGTVSYSAETNTATFQPSAALVAGTSYTAAVQATSAAGVPMATPTTWTFATVSPPPVGDAFSLYSDSDSPANPAWNDNGPVTVGIRFAADRAGAVTAVKFFAGPGNNGPYSVDVWALDGTKLGTGQTSATANGWKVVQLNSPVSITADTTYVASYRGASGHYAVTSAGLSGGRTSGPLKIPTNGGVYSYPNSFPSASTGTDFGVDVVTVLEPAAVVPPPAPSAPAVTATTPGGSGPAQPDAVATATFDVDVQAATVQMSVASSGGTTIAGTAAYDGPTKTATFTPSAPLEFGKSYTASVQATSDVGGAMATPVTWSFTTVAPPTEGTAFSLYPSTFTPANASWNDNGPVTVGTKFTTDQPGSVTAIKFYVGPGNNGPWAVDLWDAASGSRLGGGQATGLSTTGWRTVYLDASVPVQSGVTYVASYRGSAGHYAVTSGGLSAPKDAAPLRTPANAGVYSYPSAFPGSATSTDFGVDIVFVGAAA